jgi:thiamine pyrophosphate-dependent acetolactate synthase large subunit-like protein
MKVFEAAAECFRREGVGPVFSLMGSANMHFLSSLRKLDIPICRVQRENMAVAMADGHFRATGDVGVASVTVGPGLTQIATCLMVASRRHSSLVIMAGDTESGAESGDLHEMDQRAFVEASGGIFVPVRSAETVGADIRRAFYTALSAPGPVVLNMPVEIQAESLSGPPGYQRARELILPVEPRPPAEAEIQRAAEMLMRAARPVILAGRGALSADAAAAIEALAESSGALLATTLPAHGLFAGNAFDIGVAGGYGSALCTALIGDSDCLVAFGASLSYHTTQDDRLFPAAQVIDVTLDRNALVALRRPADLLIQADAALTARALAEHIGGAGGTKTGYRTDQVRAKLAPDLALAEIDARPADVEPDLLDPRLLIREIDAELPPDCVVVVSPSHSGYFPSRFLSGHRGRQFISTTEFGCIGHGMSTAIGIAVARPSRPVVVFEGDGAATMNIQELHTASQQGARVLVVVLNDQAYGSELHRLTTDPDGTALALVPSPDFAAVAAAFGLTASRATQAGQAGKAVRAFVNGDGPHLIDARLSRRVVRPPGLAQRRH